MKITVLDAGTLGKDLSLEPLCCLGQCTVYPSTAPFEVAARISDSDVVVLNKIKLNAENLANAKKLRLICVTATGYDNIDIAYCRSRGIGVCNVEGYSSHSVAMVTVSIALSLFVHLPAYAAHVKSGAYTEGDMANCLVPAYHELYGKTWGIVGFGNIGREVGKVAEAFGCRLIVCKRNTIDGYTCVDIDTLCCEADIISLHTPLTDATRHLINRKRLSLMKKDAVLVNVARGAVTDEEAVKEAILEGKIGAFGTDVYTEEPFSETHPFSAIKDKPNVLLTPHMAWGAVEARARCLDEIVSNIQAFYRGEKRGRVDLQP